MDTNVWINHLRKKDRRLSEFLEEGEVLVHPFVIGELALGEFKHREMILEHLQNMPQTKELTHPEALAFIKKHQLHGRGIGYVDTLLLGAVLLTRDCLLWTEDRRLNEAAKQCKVAFLT